MTKIQPIATSRVTDSLSRQRLSQQIQNDQLDLFRLQNQLSTGLRIFLPSDDPASAQRAIALQRTLERKEQSLTNLQGAQAALTTTEGSLASVSTSLNSLKSEALAVVSNLSVEEERQSVIDAIDSLLYQLTDVGNSTFATNYLLGGGERATAAYVNGNGYVEYLGDESTVQTFVDIGQLFDQGLSGDEVLGGLSEAVRGVTDLNLQLTPDTSLSRLHGGDGVDPDGSIAITFDPSASGSPTTTATVDLSSAKSVEDVVRLIEAGAPAGSGLVVSIEGGSLRLDTTTGTFSIEEVGTGSIAEQLGILSPTLSATINGSDLDPTIELTTRLDDLVGSKTRGRIVSGAADNDLVLTANANDASLNGLEVYFVDGAASVGSESAVLTPGSPPTLVVRMVDGASTAQDIAAAINAEGSFTAEVDYRDQTTSQTRGTGVVFASGSNLGAGFTGGVDGSLDLASGLQITNGETYTIDTSSVTTVEELLSVLNDPEYGMLATINEAGDGFDIRTRRSGVDFTIGENGGTTAADLGVRSYTGSSRLADFNRGLGVIEHYESDDETRRQNLFEITVVEDGATNTYTIDPVGVKTVQDLIDRLAAPVVDGGAGGAVTAALATTGNGLVLTVADPDSPASVASGTFSLGGDDTLTITANTPGREGNYDFTVEVVDSGGPGALSTTVSGNTIVVDLQGTTPTTDVVAADIQAQLPGFTVTSDSAGGADTVSAAVGPVSAATSGGAPQSDLAAPALGQFTLQGDTIRLTADETGTQSNQAFTVQVVNDTTNSSTGPLLTTYDSVTGTLTVNLQGVDTTTDAIAASIEAALGQAVTDGTLTSGFSVTSNGTSAVAVADVPGLPASFDATTTGGQTADTITVSGDVAERLGFIPEGETEASSTTGTLASTDTNPYEAESVFTTLLRMREALENADEIALDREVERIDNDIDRVSFGRAEVGVRLQSLEAIETRLADEEVTLRDALATEIEVDPVEVISEFTAKQFALQATLRMSGQLLNLTILDFI